MNPAPFVLVITVNHNRRDHTLRTIESLAGMTYPRFEILLVDNGSTDDSVEAVRRMHPGVGIIASATNLGFAGGFNLGLVHGSDQLAELMLIVNNDVIVAPDMLGYLVSSFENDMGAVAPMIYYYDRPDVIWSSGFRCHPLTLEMTGGQRDRVATACEETPFQVDYLLGCAMLLNRSALSATGLFDPRFYLYYEDLDLCLRLKASGFRLLTVPSAKIWHKVSGSSGLVSPLRTYHMARSSVLFFRKHARGVQRPAILAYRSGSAARKSADWLSRGDTRSLRAYFRGLSHGWHGVLDDAPYR
jgi:GT2 family glycosyltransferase